MSVERKRIQSAFQRGADQYDQHTPVQQRVIERLVELVKEDQLPDVAECLDVGCGTGRLLEQIAHRFPRFNLTGLDLADQMLCQAAARLPSSVCLIQGDAEQLPFSDSCFDLLLSSSTFQWLPSLQECFGELYRVIRPGGRVVFSMFGLGTLVELQDSWRIALERFGKCTGNVHDGTHQFYTADQVHTVLELAGFTNVKVWTETEVVYYPDVPHLLRAIKKIGAGTVRPPSGGGLGWRTVLHAMAESYQVRYVTPEGVPASYGVIYATGSR